jgi:hypothetical protein
MPTGVYPRTKKAVPETCILPGCDNKAARGKRALCDKHWRLSRGLRTHGRGDRGKRLAKLRRGHLLRTYGLTQAHFDARRAAQDGECWCGMALGDDDSAIAVHHDHLTGKVLGLVHRNCNTAMGMVKDNPAIMERLAKKMWEHQ